MDSYKTLRVSLRSPRVACLIDSKDKNWHSRALTALEAFSRTWGGAGFIVIPTDGETISKPFWNILLSYDPDYLWIAGTGENYSQQLILSDELIAQLKLRLAPFYHDDSHFTEHDRQLGMMQNLIVEERTYPNFKADYPYTDTTTIIPNCEHPDKIASISNLEGITQIWAASSTGIASTEYISELEKIGIESISFDYSANQRELFNTVANGVQSKLGEDDATFPFTFSKLQLGFYYPLEFADWKQATLVVIGESIEDFCLYFCLSRMRMKVAWLLTSWLPENLQELRERNIYQNDSLSHFAHSLRNLEWRKQQDGVTHFMSASLSTEKVEAIREFFRNTHICNVGNNLPVDITEPSFENYNEDLAKSLEFLLRYPARVFEIGNFEKIVSRHFIGDTMAGFLEPPKPKNFFKIDTNHHWITDFSIVNNRFPRHPLLGIEIVKDSLMFHKNARVGKDSIAFVDAKTGYINDDIDTWLRKPEIHLPNAFSIFDLLFKKLGYKTEISDKGRFASTTIAKFGNLYTFAEFYIAGRGKLFERFLLDNNANPEDDGKFLKSDRRWYLCFNTFRRYFNNDNAIATVIYTLLGMEVLHRGLIFKCSLCRNTDWHSITETSNEFQCKRCNLKQTYQQSHSLNQIEPVWYYKLDEVVYQALTHNTVVPILALNHLRKNTKTFEYCSELELRRLQTNEQKFEIDICCIQDGKLTIGEAKITNCLATSKREENKEITKYFELSQNIGASQVVFATTSADWQEKTKERIMNQFASSSTKVIFLTNQELFKTY